MRRKSTAVVSVALAIVIMTLVVPGPAAGSVVEVGVRLRLDSICFGGTVFQDPDTGTFFASGERSFPADADFFVRHGWSESDWSDSITLTEEERRGFAHPTTRFDLSLDGSGLRMISFWAYDAETDTIRKWFHQGFPGGLSGTHTFVGEWYLDGSIADTGVPAAPPGEFRQPLLVIHCTAVVHFVP